MHIVWLRKNLLNPANKFIDFQSFYGKYLVIMHANLFLRLEFSIVKTL